MHLIPYHLIPGSGKQQRRINLALDTRKNGQLFLPWSCDKCRVRVIVLRSVTSLHTMTWMGLEHETITKDRAHKVLNTHKPWTVSLLTIWIHMLTIWSRRILSDANSADPDLRPQKLHVNCCHSIGGKKKKKVKNCTSRNGFWTRKSNLLSSKCVKCFSILISFRKGKKCIATGKVRIVFFTSNLNKT